MGMNQKYEPLFTPWKIGNVEIKNRIVQICGLVAGLGGYFCAMQYPWAEQLYVMAAVAVIGMIVPGVLIYFQNQK